MKTVKSLMIVIPVSLALTACDGWQKSPSSDLEELRAQAKVITQMGPDKPTTINTETVVVEKVPVYIKETDVTQSMIMLNIEDDLMWEAGKAKTVKIRASLPVPGAAVTLTAANLPEGATLNPSSAKDIYNLTWTPSLVQESTLVKIPVKFTVTITNGGQAKNAAALKGMTKELNQNILVSQTELAPTELSVTGIGAEVSEDQLTPFTVIVKVPGIDGKSTQKPRVVISYDGAAIQTGKDYQELDGSRYVIADINKKDAEYLGDSKWKVSYIFDTKNIAVQPQLNKDGTIMLQADGTRIRFSVKAYGANGRSAPETLVQAKILYTKTITAPRFDVSGLGKQGLEVSPGEKIVLQFSASSNNRNAAVNVETKSSTLPGNPQVACVTSAVGASKQDCTLTWEVPCDATSKTLKGSIPMAATSTLNGRISDVTDYSLKTVKTAKDKGLCAAPAQTAVKTAEAK
ncbi:putative Ig domain-containing protein [Bdellovibrio sp. HCB288]|uniref:putative Ig domain-containing protein n=1 Tax=Bdellovibrio sp. HCB288 TaxID=3394355 RepID=UPI0039B400D3